MEKRFVSIWFRYLKADWYTRRHEHIANKPFVFYGSFHGSRIITAINKIAEEKEIFIGTSLADAKAIIPSLQSAEDEPLWFEQLLKKFTEWFIRYSPVVATDLPDGIIIDASGCTHLWGNEEKYLQDIVSRMSKLGYTVQVAIAGTIGAAWAACRYSNIRIIKNGDEAKVLSVLPAAALRIDNETIERLNKSGLKYIGDFISMPVPALRRRFGNHFILRLHQALGLEEELIQPVFILPPYHERLNCLEPITTLTGIEIALKKLLETLVTRLIKEQKGIRSAIFKVYRVDGKVQEIDIGTTRPTCDVTHLFKLFELKLSSIEPGAGIELFVLDVTRSEDHQPTQEKIWSLNGDENDLQLSLLMDRISNKIGHHKICRYLPDEHYWPERSVRKTDSLDEKAIIEWPSKIRPLRILLEPEPISVTAPVPDYPPMLFRHNGKVHTIKKADGPERIEQEWWITEGLHRDYYYVEDENGNRYWLFRSGHYDSGLPVGWFLHGYCV